MRIIAHLDMDAFFAAVEERDRPRLKGRPIVVGANPEDGKGRGVVSTANYKARAYGIHSAMPVTRAWELSEKAKKEGRPEVVFITPSGHRYGEVSDNIFTLVGKILEQACPPKFEGGNLERVSVDEAFLDLSSLGSFEKAESVVSKIKMEILSKEKLTCSIGLGPNKLIAKIASDFKKPNGLTVVREDEIEAFLEPMPIRKIPGLGPKTEIILNQIGVKTVKDLKEVSLEELNKILGKPRREGSGSRPRKASGWGIALYKKAQGLDDSPISGQEEGAKSIGEQETFAKDTLDPNFITDRLKLLTASVMRSFQKSGFESFRAVVVTVRFSGFETKNRSYTLKEPVSELKTLEFEALKLLYPFFDKRENPTKKKIRLIGVRIEKIK
ncbi:MAG: DNA polymerase IV [Candidatus Liptonbacteria bacterium]|nr:DNA polymerase IV [Candidatus Liptonbacteria bacterium]